jgi:hypothetical protein
MPDLPPLDLPAAFDRLRQALDPGAVPLVVSVIALTEGEAGDEMNSYVVIAGEAEVMSCVVIDPETLFESAAAVVARTTIETTPDGIHPM